MSPYGRLPALDATPAALVVLALVDAVVDAGSDRPDLTEMKALIAQQDPHGLILNLVALVVMVARDAYGDDQAIADALSNLVFNTATIPPGSDGPPA